MFLQTTHYGPIVLFMEELHKRQLWLDMCVMCLFVRVQQADLIPTLTSVLDTPRRLNKVSETCSNVAWCLQMENSLRAPAAFVKILALHFPLAVPRTNRTAKANIEEHKTFEKCFNQDKLRCFWFRIPVLKKVTPKMQFLASEATFVAVGVIARLKRDKKPFDIVLCSWPVVVFGFSSQSKDKLDVGEQLPSRFSLCCVVPS